MDSPEYVLAGSKLEINMPLSNDNIRKLSSACARLMSSGGKDLVIDLSNVTELTSTSIGILADTKFRVQEVGKQLKLKVPRKLMRQLDISGMSAFFEIEIA